MSENVFFAGFFFVGGAVVLVFFMKYLAAIVHSKAAARQDQAYRELAAQAAASQAETARALADIQARLGGIEKILNQVE